RISAGGAIAIAGAGIAGLSAAISLKRAGLSVEVFEREAELQPIGAGIQLGPNATRLLARWRVSFQPASCEPERIEIRNARSGCRLNAIPLGRTARLRYGSPYLTLLRKDLQEALLSRARELQIAVNFGSPVVNLKESADGLKIYMPEMSRSVAALIGADGVKSAIRQLMGSPARQYFTHTTAWRAIVSCEAIAPPLRTAIAVWMAPGSHLVHYPVGTGSAINAVLLLDDGFPPEGHAEARASPFLLRRLRGWAEEPLTVIGSSADWQPWELFAMPRWDGGRRRIQLIGDAWHAMVPYLASGAVTAIEDAAALADAFTGAQGPEEALRRFRERRSSRVWRICAASARMGRLYHCPQPFDLMRDLAIRAATGGMLLASNDWLYREPG
ncbi:MAG TPA: FAD-dependent monooxygenase, partial [Hyphomicrobiales bacterium]|nr:FAD-dependent monooxygenase [Hyphomicrobiales bacterium]